MRAKPKCWLFPRKTWVLFQKRHTLHPAIWPLLPCAVPRMTWPCFLCSFPFLYHPWLFWDLLLAAPFFLLSLLATLFNLMTSQFVSDGLQIWSTPDGSLRSVPDSCWPAGRTSPRSAALHAGWSALNSLPAPTNTSFQLLYFCINCSNFHGNHVQTHSIGFESTISCFHVHLSSKHLPSSVASLVLARLSNLISHLSLSAPFT